MGYPSDVTDDGWSLQETINYCKSLVEYSYTQPELVNKDDIKIHKKQVKTMRSRDMSYSESTLSILLATSMGSIDPSCDLKKTVKGSKSFKEANQYKFITY